MISKRISQLEPSQTLAVDAVAKKLSSDGRDVINLTLGEPDFITPKGICDAAIRAIKSGYTHYTQTSGIPELREKIAKKLHKDNHLEYKPEEIVVGVGSKQILYNALQTVINPGDEVLIPTPTWSTYVEQVKLAGGVSVFIPLAPPFKLKARDVEKYITKKTRALIINSPGNPTGAVIEPSELAKIARLAIKHKFLVISDEIYEKIIYGKNKHISIGSYPEMKKYSITVNGFSKAYAMTGWRIGYAAGPKDIIQAMSSLQSQTTSNTSSIAQYAAVEALATGEKDTKKMTAVFSKRRNYLLNTLSNEKNIEILEPAGAFYLFIRIPKSYKSSEEFCNKLLKKEFVALIPGEAFLAPGYVRLSFALSEKLIVEGVKRIKRFINNR